MGRLVCLVVLEMASRDVPRATFTRWLLQRKHGDSLSPVPQEGQLRTWRGRPECRDWDVLEAVMKRDGYRTLSHRREFRADNSQSGERKDQVELAGV
jgi:hypothetical protein